MADQEQLDIVLRLKDEMSSKLSGISSKLGSMGNSLVSVGNYATIGLGALSVGVGAIGKSALSSASEMETLKVALKTAMGGDDSVAGEAFKTIVNFSAKTPYQLGEVMNGFIKLKNMGLDPSQKALTAYGDTASAMGKGLNQMVEAVADAATGEFERLKEFGIRSSSEGDRVKFTFKGVTTEVGKNSKEIEDYLIKLGETNFGGGMDAQAQTLAGTMSTLKDNFGLAMAQFANDSGLMDIAKQSVTGLTTYIEQNKDRLVENFKNIAQSVRDFAMQAWEAIKPMAETIYNFFSGIENKTPIIVGALGAMTVVFTAWAVSIVLAMAPVVLLLTAIGVAVGGLYWIWTSNWGGIQDKTKAVMESLMQFYNTYVVPMWKVWNEKVQESLKIWRENWDNFKTIFSGAWQAIKGIFQVLWGVFSGIFKVSIDILSGNWTKAWDDMKSSFSTIFKGIYNIGAGIFKSIIGALGVMVNNAISLLNKLIEKANKVPGISIGKIGKIESSDLMSNIPTLAVGTNYVPKDTLAYIHKGEAVVPKEYNPSAGGNGGGISINFYGDNNFKNEDDMETLIEKIRVALSRDQEKANWGIS